MKLKLFACLVMAGVLVAATSAEAAPLFESFLKVDVNGYQAAPIGATEAGYQAWDVEGSLFSAWNNSTNAAGISTSFPTSKGTVNVTMIGKTGCSATAPCGTPPAATNGTRDARDRGAVAEPQPPFQPLHRDFVFIGRSRDGFGQHWVELQLSGPGIMADTVYEFTGWARDTFNGMGDPTLDNSSWQSWVDKDGLNGLNGPGAYIDALMGAEGSTYQPSIGGVNNPIPSYRRSPVSGPAPTVGDEFDYAASFNTTSDSNGLITIYAYADPNGYSGTQTVTLLNGFELGCTPEPTSLVMLLVGLAGFAGFRRRG